jgi:hypothetical protein
MKYKHKLSEQIDTLDNLKAEFSRLRSSDDDFARSYARHEFDLWLNQRYTLVENKERPKVFKNYLNEYNKLRDKMMFHITHNDLYSPKGLRNLTADELLGIIQESEK